MRFVPFLKFLPPQVGGSHVGLVHLWTDQRIPGPVSCRCPGGSLETPPRWHVTIYKCEFKHQVTLCSFVYSNYWYSLEYQYSTLGKMHYMYYLKCKLSNPASVKSSLALWWMSRCVSILWSSDRPSTLWMKTSNLIDGFTC